MGDRTASVGWRLLLALALVAGACTRGPEPSELEIELQRRLDAGFEEGLFAIRSFERTGSAPFRDAERGGSGLYVYYDAELDFQRDYALTSWRGLNLGSLAFALGATEQGISGFAPQGNRQGDVLQVYGRLVYERVDGAWRALDDLAPPATREMPAGGLVGSGPDSVLEAVRSLVARHERPSRGTRDAVIVEELRRASQRIDLGLAKQAGALSLGTGPSPGTYQEFGAAFARYATEQGLLLHDHPSQGSVENGLEVHGLLHEFGLIQSDVAEIMFTGWNAQDQIARPNLRSMASLWPEVLHVITLEGTGIQGFDDLRGRRIAVGTPGSGSRFSAIRVAAAAGLDRSDFADVQEVALVDAIALLEAGEIDALFATEAVPSLALQELAQRRRDVHAVSIRDEILSDLSERHFAYYALTVPAKSYPGQSEPFRTLGMAAVLVTNRVVPDASVERVLELVLDGVEALSEEFYRAGFISSETARLGIALPLHPAAERFYARREREESRPPDAEAPEEGAEVPPDAEPAGAALYSSEPEPRRSEEVSR